jgi:hypothetical protein
MSGDRHRRTLRARAGARRGQSLAEFTLVVPILLILLLTIADFGRYFADALRIESIARTAAEVTAQEYLRAEIASYSPLHEFAWSSVCEEAKGLPNVIDKGPKTQCDGIATMVCVHDGADPSCDTAYNTSGTVPSACNALSEPISNARAGGSETSTYVEVRVCYRFNTILGTKVPFIGGDLIPLTGDFFIQRSRVFTVADY